MALASLAMLGSALAAAPSQAAEPEGVSDRPATWDMSVEELQAIGLGQSRGDPRPVPPEFPRLNDTPRPTEGGVQPPPWIIFVNFDGATLTSGMDSAQDNITQIAECAGEFAPYGVGEKRAAVVQATRADWEQFFNIKVVDQRPASGEYTMNMTGPTNPFGGGVLGIAPVDCGNFQTHSNITYAFHSVDDGFDAATTATTIGQEVAHSYGLEHVDEPADILNPTNAGGDPTFIDECLPLTGGGGGALCAPQHQANCVDGQGQNSFQELLNLFGPAIPDVDGPVVTITAPLSGSTFEPGDSFTVIVDIIDDSNIDQAELFSNGMSLMLDTTAPWGWQINDVQAGLYTLEVVAIDEYGNEGLSTPVSILVEGGEADGTAGDDDGDSGVLDGGTASEGGDTDSAGADEDAKGCGCVLSSGGASGGASGGTPGRAPLWLAAPMLVLLGLRRRRAHVRA